MQNVNPFIDIVVQPSHGDRKVLVSWVLAQGFASLKVYVLRSVHNGAPPWVAISNSAVPGQSFEDDAFVIDNRMQTVHYRLVGVAADNTRYDSPIVGMFDKLTRAEYGGVHKMIKMEYTRMRSGNGLRAFHYLPLVEGENNPNYDEETGQHLIATCPDDDSYGLPYLGGYGPPVQTWLELMQIGPEINTDKPDGKGADTSYNVRARMLAFPKPMTNHLVIHTPTDNRYAVGEQVQPYLFKGLIPIAYDVQLRLLSRSDNRYKVPVPALRDDPTLWQ